jgi:prevent-host-death family protein
MARTVSAQDARQRLGELLEDARRDEDTIIERAGKPMGVLISPQRYDQMLRQRAESRERLFAMIDELREQNKDEDPEEIERAVDAAVAAVRRERRERRIAEQDAVVAPDLADVPG